MRACDVPRVQECAIVHGSRCTLVRPYSRNFAAVHSLACFSWGEPVSRGPMASPKYSLFCIASLCSRTSLRICASAAAIALASSPAGRAAPARTAANTSTAVNTKRTTRRKFIRSPLLFCVRRTLASRLMGFLPRQRQRREPAWRPLAFRTKIAASPRYNGSPDGRFASIAVFPFATVRPMVALILSRLALRIKKVGNGGPAQHNRFLQDILQHAAQCLCLLLAQVGAEPRWMSFCFPQTLIRVDIADTAQHALIQQQCLDPRAPFANSVRKFLFAHFEWIGTESGQLFGKKRFRQIGDAAKTPRIGIAQFAPVIQKQANVSVFFQRLPGWTRRDLAGHSQMHEQRCGRRIPICNSAEFLIRRRQSQQHEFAVTLHRFDLAARQVLLQRGRIIDKIRFTQHDRKDPPSENRLPQSAGYRFDFGKFRHKKSEPSK